MPPGVNVRITLHVPPLCATVALLMQVVPVGTIARKSLALVPLMATALVAASCTAKPPELVTVSVIFPLVVPTFWFVAKVSGLGAKPTCAATPEPVSAACCVLPTTAPESSVTVKVTPLYERTVFGVNVTIIVQLDPAPIARPFEHVVPCAPVPMLKNEESAPVEREKAPLVATDSACQCRC